MTRTRLFRLAFCLATLLPGVVAAAEPRPNVVFLLADDLGWRDLACYGSDLHETPQLDGLALQGVRFTQAYAMSVCSPTRAATLTGKHAARLRFTIWREGTFNPPGRRPLIQGDTIHDLPHEGTTLAEILRDAGYLCFHVGKWHLGDGDHAPETHGFDVNIGGTHWGAPTTFHWPFRGAGYFGDEFRYVPDLGLGEPGDYLTDRLTDEALELIDQAGDRPFLLNLWFHTPHTPIEGKSGDVRRFQQRIEPGMQHRNAEYAAMVCSLDENVGRILRRLEERGLDRRTIVIFASDNGGYIGTDRKSGQTVPVTDNAPLRSGKGSLYEGGIRVPLIVRWPGVTPCGQICDEPVTCMDFLPTIAQATGNSQALEELPELDPAGKLDGVSLVSLLEDPGGELEREAIYFHYPHYYPTTTPVSSIRSGDWKLLEFFEDERLELYNLDSDLGESENLAGTRPEIARRLQARLAAWREAVDASLPRPNPAHGQR